MTLRTVPKRKVSDLSGAEMTYIAAGVPTYGFSLYARAEVKDVPSLKGRVVGLMTRHSPFLKKRG